MGPTSHSLLAPTAACECYCSNLVFPLWIHPRDQGILCPLYVLRTDERPSINIAQSLCILAIVANPEPSSPLKES